MKHLSLYENFTTRFKRNASLFSKEESELFEDLLQEFIDKYNMIEMPKDEEEYHYFDEYSDHIQYLVQRLRNIGIDIESNVDIPLDEVYLDIKNNFVNRVKKFGYDVIYCKLDRERDCRGVSKNTITITISKSD